MEFDSRFVKGIQIYASFVFIVIMIVALGISGAFDRVYQKAHRVVRGVNHVSFQSVIDSVDNHSIEYQGKYIQLDTEVERRISESTIMLTVPSDKIWWYVKTGEKHKGHDTVYGYSLGETHSLLLYIREIEYKHFENDGDGRYYIWSRIVK